MDEARGISWMHKLDHFACKSAHDIQPAVETYVYEFSIFHIN